MSRLTPLSAFWRENMKNEKEVFIIHMKKRLFSLLLILCILLGMTAVTASAAEITVPNGWYQVTVKVAPSAAEVKFYSDSDAKTEITENVYDDGIVGGYHQYTFVAPEGTYSYRAWEGDQFLGGMEFNVPIADEYASDGTLMGKGQVLTLKRVNFVTTSGKITQPEDYTVHLLPQDLPEAVNGTNYVNGNGNVVCPIMVNAAGNALTYNMVIDINGELGNTYAVAPQQHLTFNPGTSTETSEFAVNAVTWYTITAPAAARVQMFMQKNNYNVTEILANKTETLSDGTVKTYFATSGGSSLTYRVSMANKITRAGFASISNKDMVFSFKSSENPGTTQTTAARIENSSLVNVNSQNDLRMAVGETFRLRSFRAGWEIINTDTANIMIEPDFHYNIISGAEHITMTPVSDKCTGNAGSGENSNWMDIKAVSAGTVILEVSYDAIQVDGDTTYPGLFGACGEDGKSVVVINIGTNNSNTLQITPVHGTHKKEVWDAEFDRVYFLGDTADFSFTSNMSGTVELSTDLGRSWTTVSQNDEDVYEAHGLVHGSNILRVTDGSNVQYQIVRASRLGVTVVNMTRTGDESIVVGDTVRVLFSNIYSTVPKMSGIYNPGFGSGHKVVYNEPAGVTATSSGSQYGFAADNQYELVFTETGTFTFTDGYTPTKVMGDDLGGHRLLTDAGRGVNFNAKGFEQNRSIMPDLSFEVLGMPTIKVTVESNPKGAAIEVSNASGTVIEANADGTYSLEYGTYAYKMTKDGYVPERGKFMVGGDDYQTKEKTVTISMRQVGGDIYDGATTAEPQKDANGVYLIGTGPELAWYAANHNGASAKLTADISLGGYGVQIQYLAGTFDGNGHYITDIYGSSLFSYPNSDAVIRNLGVSGEVKGNGGIVEHHGLISERTVGYTVENCVSRVDVTGSRAAGGIVGCADSGSTSVLPRIINCYNAGSVTGGYGYPGGVVGYNQSAPSTYVKNSYNIGNCNGYGAARAGRGTNSNNYTLLGAAPNAGGTALQADVLKTYAGTLGDAYLDNPTSYNDGYPILTWEEPRALAAAKEEFPAQLEAYESGDGFAEGAKAQLALAVKAGKKAIAEAETLAEVTAALEQAKKAIDEIDPEDLVLSGDVNDDGAVNVLDALRLKQYLAGQPNKTIDAANADVTGDGNVNVLDALRLVKYLAGVEGIVLGK